MRFKKLLVGAVCMALAMGMIAGCAKEGDTVNQVITETSSSETTEVSKEISEEVSEKAGEESGTEVETDTTEATETINPDDIKLRNIYMELYAKSVILPAEPDMTFDEDVKLELDQLRWVELGSISKNLGTLTTEDLLSVGYVDSSGDEATKNEQFELIAAGAKGYSFDAYYDGDIISNILVINHALEEDDTNKPEIAMKFTSFGIQVGESSEILKQLGVPSLVAKLDEEMYYYWQVETEDGGCCLRVSATDNIIDSMEILIF